MNTLEHDDRHEVRLLADLPARQAFIHEGDGNTYVKRGDTDKDGLFVCIQMPDFAARPIHGQNGVILVDLKIVTRRSS